MENIHVYLGQSENGWFFFYISNRIIIITINIIVIIFIGLTAKLGVAIKSEIAWTPNRFQLFRLYYLIL